MPKPKPVAIKLISPFKYGKTNSQAQPIARLTRIAPISQEMILNFLGSHVLGLPRSY